MTEPTKACSKCFEVKPLSEYSPNGHRKDGSRNLRPDCKNCKRDEMRARKSTEVWQRAHAKKRYGISLQEAESIWYADCCYLCGSTDPKDPRGKFHIDHCHVNGTVRKPLCMPCNLGIGRFKDSPELLRKAADYIEEFFCPKP